MATDNREDGFGSHQRGEETSRLETRLDAEPSSQGEFGSSVMEGMHTVMLTRAPSASVLYVRADPCVLHVHVPEAQGSLPRTVGGLQYVRRTRSSPGRAVRLPTVAPQAR